MNNYRFFSKTRRSILVMLAFLITLVCFSSAAQARMLVCNPGYWQYGYWVPQQCYYVGGGGYYYYNQPYYQPYYYYNRWNHWNGYGYGWHHRYGW